MSDFQPPPFGTPFAQQDRNTGEMHVNELWAKWLIDLTQVLSSVNGGLGSITHNLTVGLQGGAANEYYHLTAAEVTALGNAVPYTGATANLDLGAHDLVATNVVTKATVLHKTTTALANGAAAAVGTLNNAPAAGNPTKWVSIDDNGTVRYIPAW